MQFIFTKLRPHQSDTLNRIKSSNHKYIIVNAPAGSGKSFYPAQLAYEGCKTLVLVGTKSLQSQYSTNYDMASITGKSNYECLQSQNQSALFTQQKESAETCTIAKKDYQTFCAKNCPYPLAREEFISSSGGVTNYAKFLLDRALIDDFQPEYLFLDEAHLLSDITVDFAGLSFSWQSKEFKKYSIPFYTDAPMPVAFNQVRDWLYRLLNTMKAQRPLPPDKGGNLNSYLWHKRRMFAIQNTLFLMGNEPHSWYIETDDKGLRIRPLTARFNFNQLFNRAEKIVLMSATIDNHILRELGITDFEFIKTPNPFPVPLRPIIDLQAPRMGYSSTEQDKRIWTRKIAEILNSKPNYHTGLIHVSSKDMAYNLADRLSSLIHRKIYVPDRDIGTEQVAEEWGNHLNNGTIGIVWNLWEGYDGHKDSINIVAKVPYPDFSDGFDKARFFYDGKAGYSRTAAKMIQGLGRIRRGNHEDYGPNKFVGIADSNWKRLSKYISPDILNSIR